MPRPLERGHRHGEPVDIPALFERLKQEVGNGGAVGCTTSRWRAAAERFWPVSAERSLERRPGPKGYVAYAVKQVLRWLMRPYVEPLAVQQRAFNDAALILIDELSERLDEEHAAFDEVELLLNQANGRLDLLEGRPAKLLRGLNRGVWGLRDSPDGARGRHAYVDLFRDAAPVLDLSCGRGEFLRLLRAEGVEACGIDADAEMVACARGEGLAVEHADALSYLERLGESSLGGVFCAELLAHLPPAQLLRVLELAYAKLRPGGVLVAETINPLSPLALRNYFADLTHAQPLVPETLTLLARHAGFDATEIRYASAPEPRDVDPRINEILFAPLDYALLARR